MPAGLVNNSHIFELFVPDDYNGTTPTEQFWHMRNYNLATVIIILGDNAAGTAVTLTLRSAADAAGTSAADLDVIEYWYEIQAATSMVTSNTETPTIHRQVADALVTATDAVNQMIWFQVLAEDVPAALPWLTVVVGTPGAVTKDMAGLVILTECRYAGELRSVLAVPGTQTGIMPAALV